MSSTTTTAAQNPYTPNPYSTPPSPSRDETSTPPPRYTITPHGTLLTTLNLTSPLPSASITIYDDSTTYLTSTSHSTHRPLPLLHLTNHPTTPTTTSTPFSALSRREKLLATLQATLKFFTITAFTIGTYILVRDCLVTPLTQDTSTDADPILANGGDPRDAVLWGLNPLGLVPAVVMVVLVAAATVHLCRAAAEFWRLRAYRRRGVFGGTTSCNFTDTPSLLRRKPRDWFKDLPKLQSVHEVEEEEDGEEGMDFFDDDDDEADLEMAACGAGSDGIVLVSPRNWAGGMARGCAYADAYAYGYDEDNVLREGGEIDGLVSKLAGKN